MLTLPNMDYGTCGHALAEPADAANIGEQRIVAAFDTARRRRRRAALMAFLMGGFPSLAASRAIGEACIDAGADIVELGIPCADPVFDGPVIRAAADAALRAGATVAGVLGVAEALSARVAVVVMCYADLVVARGAWRFANELREAGVSGLVVPDLSPIESVSLRLVCDCAGVALVPVVAPATADDDTARLGASARGFVYTAEAGADGIVIGSRLVRAAGEARADAPAAVHALVGEFAETLTGVWPRLRRASRLDVTDSRWRSDSPLAAAA